MKAQESDASGPFLRIGGLFRAWRTCRAANPPSPPSCCRRASTRQRLWRRHYVCTQAGVRPLKRTARLLHPTYSISPSPSDFIFPCAQRCFGSRDRPQALMRPASPGLLLPVEDGLLPTRRATGVKFTGKSSRSFSRKASNSEIIGEDVGGAAAQFARIFRPDALSPIAIITGLRQQKIEESVAITVILGRDFP